MKATNKVLALVLALIMCLALVACGSSSQGNESAPINYSLGLDTTGNIEGIKALDYVTLGQYTGLEYPEDVLTVTDEELQEALDDFMSNYTYTEKVTDRAIADKDTVNIDYTGYVDGEAFENGSTKGSGTDIVVGTTKYVDDFIEQLVGHKPGETFDIEVTFPDPYENNPALAGKDATFTVTINYITETHTYELTDDFVVANLQEKYGLSTVEDVKDNIRGSLREAKTNDYMWDTILENATFKDIPEKIGNDEMSIVLDQAQYYADYYKTDLATILATSYSVADEEAFRTTYKQQYADQAKYHLLVQALAEDAGLLASGEDVGAYFKENMPDEDLLTYVANYGNGYIYRAITTNKVIDYLAAQNPVPEA